MMFYIIKSILFLPLKLLFPVKTVNKKNVPQKGAFILITNHQGNMDPVYIASNLRRRIYFMAKAEIFRKKLPSKFFKAMGAYPVERGTNDLKAVKQTLSLLKSGKAVGIFPEGTRTNSDESNEIKSGTAMFALKTGVPIVPSFFIKKVKMFKTGRFIIGKPFNLSEMAEFKDKKITREILDEASIIIKNSIYNIKKEYIASLTKKKRVKYEKYLEAQKNNKTD